MNRSVWKLDAFGCLCRQEILIYELLHLFTSNRKYLHGLDIENSH